MVEESLMENNLCKVVFLSACYSESIALPFLEAGVSHVICIEKTS